MPGNYDPKLETWKAENQFRVESGKGIFQFATLTIRSLLMINGGAVVVLMALLGSLWNANESAASVVALALVKPFQLFIGGLVAGVLTGGLGYFAQVVFTESLKEKRARIWGNVLRGAAVVFGSASIFVFGRGSLLALEAFS